MIGWEEEGKKKRWKKETRKTRGNHSMARKGSKGESEEREIERREKGWEEKTGGGKKRKWNK